MQVGVGIAEVALPVAGPLRRRQGEPMPPCSVDEQVQLVRGVQPLHLFIAVAGQTDAELVLAGAGEQMLDEHAAPRAQRQPVDVPLLRAVRPDAIHLAGRLRLRQADRLRGDPLGRGEGAVQPRRRQLGHGDVVESAGRLVLRQQLGGVDVEGKQVADGVAVLGTGQPPHRGHGSDAGVRRGVVVEQIVDCDEELCGFVVVRTVGFRRRHLAGRDPPPQRFPFCERCIDNRVGAQRFGVEPAGRIVAAVAVGAVRFEERGDRRRRRPGCVVAGHQQKQKQHGDRRRGQAGGDAQTLP